MNPSKIKERVLDALMGYALDNVALFCNAIRKGFGYDCNTGECYRALYLYKCRKYDHVLHLCGGILKELIFKKSNLEKRLSECAFMNILVLPPLDSFFDRDIQLLLAFQTIFYYLLSLDDHIRVNKEWSKQWCATYTFQNGLSFCIEYHYPHQVPQFSWKTFSCEIFGAEMSYRPQSSVFRGVDGICCS